jgi:hypothetical protein
VTKCDVSCLGLRSAPTPLSIIIIIVIPTTRLGIARQLPLGPQSTRLQEYRKTSTHELATATVRPRQMVSLGFPNPLGTVFGTAEPGGETKPTTVANNKHEEDDGGSSDDCSMATSLTEDDPLGAHAMAQRPPRYSTGMAETVLWPGGIYIIFEKASGRVITHSRGIVTLQDVDADSSATDGQVSNRWLCVERNGYFGLHDPKSGRYVGHNNNYGMVANATEFNDWESIVPRAHPDGGFQLLVPHWWHSLRTVVVGEDGRSLVTRPHGETIWTFLKVA